jgi:hypothetical protein
MTHVFGNDVIDDSGQSIGSFKSHWQAVAAMIRISNPQFESTGGDSPETIGAENEMRQRIGLPPLAKASSCGRQP